MSKLKALRQRRAELRDEGTAIVQAYKAESRDPTETEDQRLGELHAEIEQVETDIEQAERRADIERALVVESNGREIEGGRLDRAASPTGGFDDFGEYCVSLVAAARPGMPQDPRLVAAPTTITQESTGADGGYLVPVEFAGRIFAHSLEEDAFLPMTDNDTVRGNSMTFPRDETTPWGSNGVRAYWEAEASQATQTKASLGSDIQRLHKLFALAPVTEEMVADSALIGGYVERKAGESIRWKTNDALMNGTGAGQPLGMLNANNSALVVQAKETSQTADTIVAGNVVKMFPRLLNPARGVWVVNPDAWPQLPLMTIGDQPVFTLPAGGGGLTSTPSGFLLGRPVMMSDTMQTVGDQGDLAFIDWRAYHTITKVGGVRTATSMHLWFDYDVMAFRATFRIDGAPWHKNAVTPPNSAVTRSSAVVIAARA